MTKSEHSRGDGGNVGQPHQQQPVPNDNQGQAYQQEAGGYIADPRQAVQYPDGTMAPPPHQPTHEYAPQPGQAPVPPHVPQIQQQPPLMDPQSLQPPLPPQPMPEPAQEFYGEQMQQGAPMPPAQLGEQQVNPAYAPQTQAQAPLDDYQYPQGQAILPEVPLVATPPGMAVPPEQITPAHQSPQVPLAQQYGEQAGNTGYAEPAEMNPAGEQISQRLAQLQSQYDNELSGEVSDPVPNRAVMQEIAASEPMAREQLAGYQPPVEDYAAMPPMQAEEAQRQAYQQQPPTYQQQQPVHGQAYQEASVPQEVFQAQTYQDPQQFQEPPQSYAQPQSYQEQPPAYMPPPPGGQPGMVGEPVGGPATAQQNFDREEQTYAAAPFIAQEEISGTGAMKKLALGGAFAAALAVGGGAAYTYKYTDVFGAQESGVTAPTIKATASPIKIIKQKMAGAKASMNKAMHNRLGGGGNTATRSGSRDSIAMKTMSGARSAGSNVAGATSGMLAGNGGVLTGSGGPRRVKTLVVRPDGTIMRPARTPDLGKNAANTATGLGVAPSSLPKANGMIKKAGDGIRRMKTIGEASNTRRLGGAAVDRVNNLAGRAQTQQAAKKVIKAPRVKPVETARVATAPLGAIGTPFVVQVTSRSSQTSALAAFADMQQKYPSLLGRYAPDIQRADLGAKGVWYRLRVGPVRSKTAAGDLCDSLKKAGHPGCFVRRK